LKSSPQASLRRRGCGQRLTENQAMGTLYLVRHGQASFGADNYDVLSPLGHRQAERLGQYLKERGIDFEAAITGTLQRQRQTHAGICRGLGRDVPALELPALNEYDSHALIEAMHPQTLSKPDTPELYRQHFRLLRQSLQAWIAGQIAPRGMPSYGQWCQGIEAALDHVRQRHQGAVLLVSSGGPIATAVGQVIDASPTSWIELNLRIRNASVTQFEFNPKRHSLLTYNTLPHFDAPEYADWVTYT
jgi:broad specificity phosphatase PhoE